MNENSLEPFYVALKVKIDGKVVSFLSMNDFKFPPEIVLGHIQITSDEWTRKIFAETSYLIITVLFAVNDHGSNQRYAFPTDTYGSLFGTGLDLKSDLVNGQQHQPPPIVYSASTPTFQQQNAPAMLSTSGLQAGTAVGPSHTIGIQMRPCVNSTPTPTVYTIEDHASGNLHMNLASSIIVPTAGGNPTENQSNQPNAGGAQQKKRKLSMSECFPIATSVGTIASLTKSPSVKQEPRKAHE